MRVRVETPPDCTGVAEMTDCFMGVLEIQDVFTGVADTPPDRNTMSGTPTLHRINGVV